MALKFLSRRLMNDTWGKRQLIREAQAVAHLDHPNICAVYGFEEDDGHNFIVMKYVEGETLAALLQKGDINTEQIISLIKQVISALAEAHAHGIIHRDIKPQNIMVTADGQVKVLDFGLAKLVQQRNDLLDSSLDLNQSSHPGLVIGTVTYMSPEQLRVGRLDFRTDIFSLGIVLYELISGKNPFARASRAETISAILSSDPPPLKRPATKIASGLSQIAQKCLEREPEQRYQSASAMMLDLENLQKGIVQRQPWTRNRTFRSVAALALLVALVVSVAAVYDRWMSKPALAVLPIINEVSDADAEALSRKLTTGLIKNLKALPKLRIKTPVSVPTYRNPASDLITLGRELGANRVLVGRLKRPGEKLTVQFTLLNAENGAKVWGEELNVEPGELELLQQEVSLKLSLLLRHSLSEEQKMLLALLATRQNRSPGAYELYLLGRYYWNDRDSVNIRKAIDSFDQAIRLEPNYARAYAGLADSYVLLSTVAYGSPQNTNEVMAKAKSAAKKALERDDTLCEAHTSLGVYLLRHEWNWQEAEKEFRQAISLNPEYAPAHYWYSNLLALTRRSTESIAESEKAKDLEPFSPHSYINLGRAYHYAAQYDRAAEQLLKILEKNPNALPALNVLGYVYHQQGRVEESISLFERLYAAEKLYGAAPLGYAYAKAGRRADAQKILDELEAISKQTSVPLPQEKAIIYLGLDDRDRAFTLLQEACKERFATFPFLFIEPFLDSIRSDPRFPSLLRCARLSS